MIKKELTLTQQVEVLKRFTVLLELSFEVCEIIVVVDDC